MSGNKQTVTFQSSPENATVTVAGRVLGKTPLSITLDKQRNQNLVFALPGYKSVEMQLTTQIDGWFWGNIVLGGLIGSTTDGLNGSVYAYSPSQYFVTLQPEKSGVDGKTSLTPDQQVKSYVVVNHNRILQDLSTHRSTEVTTSLFRLLAIRSENENPARERLSKLATANPDAVAFASAVVKDFRVPTALQ